MIYFTCDILFAKLNINLSVSSICILKFDQITKKKFSKTEKLPFIHIYYKNHEKEILFPFPFPKVNM